MTKEVFRSVDICCSYQESKNGRFCGRPIHNIDLWHGAVMKFGSYASAKLDRGISHAWDSKG